jgi:hypothetical protein
MSGACAGLPRSSVSYVNGNLYLLLAGLEDTAPPKNFQPAPVLVSIAPAVITIDMPIPVKSGFEVDMSRE